MDFYLLNINNLNDNNKYFLIILETHATVSLFINRENSSIK